MPLIQRFVTTTQGAMILTGNTLNCRDGSPVPPQTIDYRNGSFISTNTALVAGAGFPPGTTNVVNQSSSTAIVDIPSGSTILYAQLFWIINTSSYLTPDNPITFITPTTSLSLAPDLALKQTFSSYIVFQARDVKSIIESSGSGVYTVGAVPGKPTINNSTQVGNGWALIIVYKNSSMPTRYFNINTGVSPASAGSPSDFTFTGFSTPTSGTIKAYLLVTETNGDLVDQAQIFIGSSLATSTQYGNASNPWNGVAPYSAINNMLPANILIADCNNPNIGLLDTRGTFGTYNRDPFTNSAPGFARLNMDVAGWDISSKLANNQTSLFTRVTYLGPGSGQVTSQSVQVDVNSADLSSITKILDKTFADVGESITYTVTFKNEGLANANNVVFIDTLPNGTSLIQNTLTINGVLTNTTPQLPGIKLGVITSNQVVTIGYKVQITSTVPSPNPLANNSQVTYNYVPLAGLSPTFTDNISNTVLTTINNATLNTTKVVNKNFANVGDILTYTIPIKNNGNVTAFNVIFQDTIPNDTTLVANSFTENGNLVVGGPNPPGVTLSNIKAGDTTTIVFKVKVNTIPCPNPILNSATTFYTYTIDPSTVPNRANTTSSNTNIVSTQVNNANLGNISKTVDKTFANCGDTINYTIVIPNNGNVTAQNVIFKDTIPNGTELIGTSVFVNNSPQSGADPSTGITIPNIAPGGTATVNFSVRVTCN